MCQLSAKFIVTVKMASDALNDYVSDDYLQDFEVRYNKEKDLGTLTDDLTFQYAWCLVRSRLNSDVRKGLALLRQLLEGAGSDSTSRRDYLYYIAVGYTRLKEYSAAMKAVKTLLQMEPGNRQAQELEKAIEKSMNSDAVKGAAIAGGGLLVAGGIVALGMALLKK